MTKIEEQVRRHVSQYIRRTGRTFGTKHFGLAWLFFAMVFALHTWDQAAHDFVGYYNATVLALYGHFSWFPRIDIGLGTWLATLILINLGLLALTPLAFRDVAWLRPLAYGAAVLGLISGIGHVLVSIRGQTVPSVGLEGVSPGFYTSPLILVSATYLLSSLRRESPSKE